MKLISKIDGKGVACAIALELMPLNLTDYKPTLVQVMTWCHQAPSHYLSQCWPRSMTPCGVTGPQWVKLRISEHTWLSSVHCSFQCVQSLRQNDLAMSPSGHCWNYHPSTLSCCQVCDAFRDHAPVDKMDAWFPNALWLLKDRASG